MLQSVGSALPLRRESSDVWQLRRKQQQKECTAPCGQAALFDKLSTILPAWEYQPNLTKSNQRSPFSRMTAYTDTPGCSAPPRVCWADSSTHTHLHIGQVHGASA